MSTFWQPLFIQHTIDNLKKSDRLAEAERIGLKRLSDHSLFYVAHKSPSSIFPSTQLLDQQMLLDLTEGGPISVYSIWSVSPKCSLVPLYCWIFPYWTNQNKPRKNIRTYPINFSIWRLIYNHTKPVRSSSETFLKIYMERLCKMFLIYSSTVSYD